MEDAQPLLDQEHLALLRDMEAGESSGKLARMFRDYLASVPPQFERMRESLASGDLGRLVHEAHGLAGSSAMYGMPRLCHYSQALEARARGHRLEGASELLAVMERTFAEARPLLVAELSLGQ